MVSNPATSTLTERLIMTDNNSTVVTSLDNVDPGIAWLVGKVNSKADAWRVINTENATKGKSAEDIAAVLAQGTPEAKDAQEKADAILEAGKAKAAKVIADAKEKAKAAQAEVLSAFMEQATKAAEKAGTPDVDGEKAAKVAFTKMMTTLKDECAEQGLDIADLIGFLPDNLPSGSTFRAPSGDKGYDPTVVRAWAVENGVEVSERGRISGDVLQAWNDAQVVTA